MTGNPELTITRPCPTCGGTGKLPDTVLSVAIGHISDRPCPDCEQGVVRVAVNCAGCKYYFVSNEPSDPTYYGWCDHPDMKAMDVLPTWGCLSWQAKEATDGNG